MRLHIIAPTYDPRVVAGAGLTLVNLTSRLFDYFPEAKIYLNVATARAFPEWRSRISTVPCGQMTRPWRKALSTARLQWRGFPEFPQDGVCWFPFGPMMPVNFKGRGVSTMHDTLELDRPETVPLLERFFRSVMIPRTVRRTRVVTISQFSKRRLEHHFGIQPEVVTWGIDSMAAGDDRKVPGQPYVFYPANTYDHKNHRFLLKLWESNKRLCDIALVFTAGSGTRSISGELARARAAGARIIVTGRVSEDELAGLFRNALCTVLPTQYEGYGLPMRESLLCECPVIANAQCEALHETVRPDYPLFLPLDSGKWVEAILRMRETARSPWPDFVIPRTWDECAQEYAAIFRSVNESAPLIA